MRHLDCVVQTFMGAVIRIGRQRPDRLDVAAQFVGDNDPGLAIPGDQSGQEPLCRFRIPTRLYEDVEHVSIRIDGPPEPMFYAADCDHHLV